MKRFIIATMAMGIVCTSAIAQRTETVLHDGWKFYRQDNLESSSTTFDDSKWEEVTVPHDWAISGPFSSEHDKQVVAIQQNGEKEATEHTGRTGSLPWIGTGWYRLQFETDKNCERAILNFDGAMAEPIVYVNGHEVGEWKYGYNTFNVDITPYINKNTNDNQLAVRLQNVPESSRWYPGAGIFRPVTLIQTNKTAIDTWGVNFVTEEIRKDAATVTISASVTDYEGKQIKVGFLLTPLTSHNNSAKEAIQSEAYMTPDGQTKVSMSVPSPNLWSPETPNLYALTVSVYEIDLNSATL